MFLIIILTLVLLRLIYVYKVRDLLRNMLKDVISAFNSANVDYVLDSSVLLNLFRVNDVELGTSSLSMTYISIIDNKIPIENAMLELAKKYSVSGDFTSENPEYVISKYGFKFHIYGAVETEQGFVINKLLIPIDLIDPVMETEIVIKKELVRSILPGQTVELLKYRYGNDFMNNQKSMWSLYF